MTTATASPASLRTVRFGERDLELGGKYLGELRDSSALRNDGAALRQRFAEDGYLFIRGMHRREAVLEARRALFEDFAKSGVFDPAAPLMDGIIHPDPNAGHGRFEGGAERTRLPAYLGVVEGEPVMSFFDTLFGERSLTFDYKWMRLVGKGDFTGAHLDNVYMGRGSAKLCTTWTPIGDIPLEMGPLAVLVGSHRLPSYERIRSTYGQMDVDRDRVGGWFEGDPVKLVDAYGGRWATADFQAGDALVFGMYTMHASLTNVTNRYRLSCDTRYQPASEPADERWMGEKPIAHYAWHSGPQVSMEVKRKEWGV